MIFSNQDRFSKLKKQKERAEKDEFQFNPPSSVYEVSAVQIATLFLSSIVLQVIVSIVTGVALCSAE